MVVFVPVSFYERIYFLSDFFHVGDDSRRQGWNVFFPMSPCYTGSGAIVIYLDVAEVLKLVRSLILIPSHLS